MVGDGVLLVSARAEPTVQEGSSRGGANKRRLVCGGWLQLERLFSEAEVLVARLRVSCPEACVGGV